DEGLWAELSSGKSTTVYRRNLQKIHVEKLIELTNPGSQSTATITTFQRPTASLNPDQSDIRSLSLGRLEALDKRLKKAARRTKDDMTKYHYQDLRTRIKEVLEP